MNGSNTWQRLGSVHPSDLTDTRNQLHHAAQLLASVGQTLAAPQPDDSHRAMSWDPEERAFRSGGSESSGASVLLSPAPFEVRVEREGGTASHSLAGVTLADAYAWLEGELQTPLGRPEYEIPGHAVASGAPFDAASAALAEMACWYGNAAAALSTVIRENASSSPVRCWPHHFDLATLITLPPDSGDTARSIGVGMSPGDGTYPEPYAYVTPWPYPWEADRPELPSGRWHTTGWLGAVLTADGWLGGAADVRAFYTSAIAAAKSLLGD